MGGAGHAPSQQSLLLKTRANETDWATLRLRDPQGRFRSKPNTQLPLQGAIFEQIASGGSIRETANMIKKRLIYNRAQRLTL